MKKKLAEWLLPIAGCFVIGLLTWISLELGILDRVILRLIDMCGTIVAIIIAIATYIYFDKKSK